MKLEQNSSELTVMPNQNRTEICVFGKCYYCKESESVCADDNGLLEGAIIQLVPGALSKYRSPWQRTYKDNQKAEWEDNMQYCEYENDWRSFTTWEAGLTFEFFIFFSGQ